MIKHVFYLNILFVLLIPFNANADLFGSSDDEYRDYSEFTLDDQIDKPKAKRVTKKAKRSKSNRSRSRSRSNSKSQSYLKLKYRLSQIGINYNPWADRLNNDYVLMRKLLKLKSVGNKFSNYKVVSTKGRTIINSKERIIFVNYRSSSSSLKKLFSSGVELKRVSKSNKTKKTPEPKLAQRSNMSNSAETQNNTKMKQKGKDMRRQYKVWKASQDKKQKQKPDSNLLSTGTAVVTKTSSIPTRSQGFGGKRYYLKRAK